MGIQAVIAVEHIKRFFPEAVQSKRGSPDLAIPR